MGLDIDVYTKCKQTADNSAEQNTFSAFSLEGCSINVVTPGIYTYESRMNKWSGAYSSYNAHRNQLCEISTGNNIKAVWANPKPEIRFIELINTSDCEGSFDTATCKELAKDFTEQQEIVSTIQDPQFQHFYTAFREAFTIAAENEGFVCFG